MGLVFNVVSGGGSMFTEKTVSGNPIAVSDVYDVQHNVRCKISGVADPTSVAVIRFGKNWFDALTAEKTLGSYVEIVSRSVGEIVIKNVYQQTTGWRDAFFPLMTCDQATATLIMQKAKFSCVANSNDPDLKPFAEFDYSAGRKLLWVVLHMHNKSNFPVKTTEQTAAFSNIQLEISDIATPYEPFESIDEYNPAADGSVVGMTALSPNMTILTNDSGALITATYKADRFASINNDIQALNRSIDNTNNAILATGGNL